MADLSDRITDAAVSIFILAFIGMLALVELFTASTTSIPPTVVTVVTVLVGIFFGLGVALAFYRKLIKSKAE